MVSLHSGTPLGVGTSHGHFGPQDTPRLGLGGSHHLPHIVFSAPHFGDYIQMALFPGTPKLESRNCPETISVGVPGLWELITLDCEVWSQRGLNQTCSSRRDLSNDVSHSQFGGREEVDSWLFVVGSQTANLTLGPSFAHNLGYGCPNGQGKAIFVIYASRPFQWHQEHLNSRCFGPCCRALNIRESRRTPNPQLWECWASPSHLAKVGLRQSCSNVMWTNLSTFWNCWHLWFLFQVQFSLSSKVMTRSNDVLHCDLLQEANKCDGGWKASSSRSRWCSPIIHPKEMKSRHLKTNEEV
jgi:hypothetical protein